MVATFSTAHSDRRGLRDPCFSFAILALMGLAACGQDEAHREAMAAAEIADHGGPLEEQIAHYDRAIELEAINAIVPPKLRKGVFRPEDKLLAMLRAERLCGVKSPLNAGATSPLQQRLYITGRSP